jgi:DNA-binding NtrC family response regulator
VEHGIAQAGDENEVAQSTRRPTILVVDDDPDVLEVTEVLLGRKDYEVRTAANGDEAISMVSEPGLIDLVLIDVVMPGQNGFAVSQRMLEMRPDLKMLYMSGYSRQLNYYSPKVPTSLFLAKPFGPTELWTKVDRLVG